MATLKIILEDGALNIERLIAISVHSEREFDTIKPASINCNGASLRHVNMCVEAFSFYCDKIISTNKKIDKK